MGKGQGRWLIDAIIHFQADTVHVEVHSQRSTFSHRLSVDLLTFFIVWLVTSFLPDASPSHEPLSSLKNHCRIFHPMHSGPLKVQCIYCCRAFKAKGSNASWPWERKPHLEGECFMCSFGMFYSPSALLSDRIINLNCVIPLMKHSCWIPRRQELLKR